MSTDARRKSLEDKHHLLDKKIHIEEIRPQPDSTKIHKLKKQKLQIKEELSRL